MSTLVKRKRKGVTVEPDRPQKQSKLSNDCVCHMQIGTGKYTQHLYVIEQEPAVRDIAYTHYDHNVSLHHKILSLSMPRLLWFITVPESYQGHGHSIALCATMTKFSETGLKTNLYVLPLPNQGDYGHGSICTGNTHLESKTGDTAEKARKLLEQVMTSHWNADLAVSMPKEFGKTILDWAKRSKTNPKIGETTKYKSKHLATVKSYLSNASKNLRSRIPAAQLLKPKKPRAISKKKVSYILPYD